MSSRYTFKTSWAGKLAAWSILYVLYLDTSYTLLTGKSNSFVLNILLYLLWGLRYGGIKVFTRIIRRRRRKTIRDFGARWFRTLPVSLMYNSGSASFALLRKRQLSIYKVGSLHLGGDISIWSIIHSEMKVATSHNIHKCTYRGIPIYSPVYILGNSLLTCTYEMIWMWCLWSLWLRGYKIVILKHFKACKCAYTL